MNKPNPLGFFKWLMSASLLTAVLFTTAPAQARDLASVKPDKVGMSAERLQRITEMSRSYVDQGRVPGMITMVSRGGKVVHFEAVGKRGAKDDQPLTKDALFRIYSMSKPITAVAAMQLYEQGKFQLSDPISKWLPELSKLEVLQADGTRVPANKPITMQHLLTHTAGFSYGFDPNDPVDVLYREAGGFQAKNLDEFAKRLSTLPLKYQPGSQWHYSVAVDLTGLIVERISGMTFDAYLKQHIFEPLGMNDTFFSVPADKMDRFLPNHAWDTKNNQLMTLGKDSYERFQNVTMFSGGGGLVSSTEDYMRFAQMLANGGTYNGTRLLSPRTVEFMTMNHLPASVAADGAGESPSLVGAQLRGFGFGLGFGVVTDVAASGVLGSVGEYNWGGAAGTVFWVDPTQNMVAIAMIQLMGSPWPLRSDFKVATNQAIVGPYE